MTDFVHGPATLRPFKQTDAGALPVIYREAVRTLGAEHYDAAEIAAWLTLAPTSEDYARRAFGSHTIWVAEIGGHPIAYADLEPDGHIDHLYCVPMAAGRGIAAALVLTLEAIAHDRGIDTLHVEASETARPLFERLGWTTVQRRDLRRGDVLVQNYAMRRDLPSPATSSRSDSDTFFESYRCATGATGRHQVVAFGDSGAMKDELAALALNGTKRATAALLREFVSDEPIPFVGAHVVLLDGHDRPCAVWRTTEVRVGRLDDVDEAFAWDEGEGERTRADWLQMHRRYFGRMAIREVFEMNDAIPTVFERFEIVWPPQAVDPDAP